MRTIFKLPFCLLALALLPLTTSAQTENTDAPAQLPWQVCNETSFVQDVATVSIQSGETTSPLTVRGWTKLLPGDCETIDAEKGTPRFVYAKSASVHQGGIREWRGEHEYCVAEEDFEAKTDLSCPLQNMQPRGFLRVIPTEHRTAFVEPEDYGRKAVTAGLQRLLLDNNYDIKRVDGITGRRTTNTLNKFLKDHEIATDISTEEKFAALEKFAREAQTKIGVTICNESSARVWSALATTSGDELESRGWWPIDTGACLRPYTKSLKDNQVHFYARQEKEGQTDKVLKVASKSSADLCVGEAKFAAVRQEFCEDQGYLTARFHALPLDQTGARIILKDANFGDAAVSGLRQ